MGKQYSFKVTRRTEYLERVLDEVPDKDRSEVIRQALAIGLEHMGLLTQQPNIFGTFASKTSEVGTTKVEQVVDKGDKKVSPSPVTPLPEPSFTVLEEEEPKLEDLENALDNIQF